MGWLDALLGRHEDISIGTVVARDEKAEEYVAAVWGRGLHEIETPSGMGAGHTKEEAMQAALAAHDRNHPPSKP